MRSFLTGMVIGMLGAAAAAHYLGEGKLIDPKLKQKTRRVMAQTAATGCILNQISGKAGRIIRK